MALTVLAALSAAHGSLLPALAQSPNPCIAALATAGATAVRTPADRAAKYGRFGRDTRHVRDILQFSSAASQARARAATTGVSRPTADRDDNHIAILEDHGDLIVRPNPFDLANTGVRFEPAGGGYAVATASGAFRDTLGRAVTLGDDDSVSQTIAFPFQFYGTRATSLFVNSDGNLTFEAGDNASTERGIDRLVSGAPRIAPFFADLDPSAGGRVFFDSGPDAATITWCAVPGFDDPRAITMQAVLFSSGAIEFRFGSVGLRDGIVALSPGRTETFTAINLNPASGQVTEAVAIGEQFIASASLDLVAASQRFYQTHPDAFDQLVFWTDSPAISDAFAFEVTVQNAITGTGLDVFNFSTELGSAGTLQSVVHMDRVAKYPDTPTAKLSGEITTLGILAHETGHRWLAKLLFRNVDRAVSDQLLGRQRAHWSFFMDSDGSVMEGNDIEDLGGGAFRTVSATEKYSRLDLYAMGLATDSEVPRWFYIDAPTSRDREDPPLVGALVNGTRRDVLIQDVIDALGPRVPAAADSTRLHRQAFVYVRQDSAVLNPQDLNRLGRIREEFGPFFNRATENRMTVRTTLTP